MHPLSNEKHPNQINRMSQSFCTEEDAFWVKSENDPESDIANMQQADTIACILFVIVFFIICTH